MRRRAGRGPAAPVAVALLVAALLVGAAQPAAAALFAIDLGAEFLKLSIVKPGRIPISIVINEMSKRKTPALVAFTDGDRLVGEEAASIAARFPERVYGRVIDLLGRPADDPALAAMLKASYRPYTLVPAANRTSPAAAALKTHTVSGQFRRFGGDYSSVLSGDCMGALSPSAVAVSVGNSLASSCRSSNMRMPRSMPVS